MTQQCYASISDTGLHCIWCITRNVVEDGIEMSQIFCEKHNLPCQELGYYCSDFAGYKPDYRMTDEEEMDLIEKLRNKAKKGE